MAQDRYEASLKFVSWLEQRLLLAGRGDEHDRSPTEPAGRFWLGRLAPEEQVAGPTMADRIGRLEPCAIGIRVRPAGPAPWSFEVGVRAYAWIRENKNDWRKLLALDDTLSISINNEHEQIFGAAELNKSLAGRLGREGLAAEVRVEATTYGPDEQPELLIQFVNCSPEKDDRFKDTRFYQTELQLRGVETEPFLLEALPDSFRYDRRIPAYGVNCGAAGRDLGFSSTDTISADRPRPKYWGLDTPPPDLTFETLQRDPFPSLQSLVTALERWGHDTWSAEALANRSVRNGWSAEMHAEARSEAEKFRSELQRVRTGLSLLEANEMLLRAFRLMNRAIRHASCHRGYEQWRPFQIGFILANLSCILEPAAESEIVDIVWFATGGGKTETYLGLLITAAIFDRLQGKQCGITAWTRFPLRMLSLQQLQRFADAMAAAEIVRRSENIPGAPFAMGFFVGQGATPNRIPVEPKEGEPDPDDENMPAKYKVLQRCPFCGGNAIEMQFDRVLWKLDHICRNPSCDWPVGSALPFYVVDEEIYRFLPTIVVGTLDKAASIGMQAAMRGLVGAPLGMCSKPGHGFTYAPRSDRKNGCFVPGCKHTRAALPMAAELFGPSYRLQDELHLLRDSLGAVDAHYEALLDGLEEDLCGRRPKILASSATLEGFEGQVDVLYRRKGRVFPQAGPSKEEGFWTTSSQDLMRRFVAVAPRGLTIEFVIDRMCTEMQDAVRLLKAHPADICDEIGIEAQHAEFLVSHYGTQVVYGNTLRDLDAVERSLKSGQIRPTDEQPVNHAVLTGRTDFQDVAAILDRLEKPEENFEERIHLITASSMMSHGVDIDRLNVMVMAGLPLGSAEFIQATARVGRRWPGLVFVIHKIGRERDASVFRSFEKFVEHADRFIEPIPITRKSRRVLDRTIAGLEMARIHAIHEPAAGRSLATLANLRQYIVDGGMKMDDERQAIMRYLGIDADIDARMAEDLERWFQNFEQNVMRPIANMRWPADACPLGKPMISLRDVEEQVPLFLDRR